jgi:hypothetical protein
MRERGATYPGFLDVVIVAALMAVLLYAAWRQFPAYQSPPPPPAAASHKSS